MPLSFNLVPADIRVPGQYIEIDNSKAFRGLTGLPTKLLLIGQKLAAGTAAALTPVQLTSTDQAKTLFGKGSQLAHMAEAAFRVNRNSTLDIWAIPQVDNGAGVAATGAITFGGDPTESGTLNLYIGGRRVQIAVSASDTPANAAAALVTAITALPDLAVTAVVDGVDTAKVNLTAKNKGVNGNKLDIRTNYYADESTPAGLTVTITAMSTGSGNPDITAVFAAIGDQWYTDFAVAYDDTTNIVALEDELQERFGPLKMIDGHAFIGVSDTHANLITKGSGRNSPHVTLMGAKGSPTPPHEWAAALGAQCAYFGKQDPARPVQTLDLTGLMPPKITDRFTLVEQDLLLRNGISTFMVDDGDNIKIQRVITTYRENAFGAPDPSFLDVETLKTLSYLRFDTRAFIALNYPRYKLADDGTKFARGQAVVTPSVIRAALIARFQLWEEAGLVENIDQFKEDLIVERDTNDPNRLNALIPPDIINQLRVFAALLQFRL